ncbi:MAG: rhodanese-like domain-containing protein [Bacteroidota bacterium]
MKKNLLLLLTIFSFGYAANAQVAQVNEVVTNLSALRFKAITDNNKDGMIIDLRTTEEMNKGYIKNAVQLDFLAKDAEQKIDKLDKNKTYYVYCASGRRSAEAAEYMHQHGFKRVYNLEKGFSEWEKNKYPVEKK